MASGGAVKAACFHMGVCLALEEKGFSFKGGTLQSPKKLENAHYPIDIYVGSSAGSVLTSLIAQGYTLSEIVDSFMHRKKKSSKLSFSYMNLFSIARPQIYKNIKKWFSFKKVANGTIEAFFKNFITLNSPLTTEGIEKYLRTKALKTNKFQDLCVELYIVATKLDHSAKTIFGPRSLTEGGYCAKHHCDYNTITPISIASAASASLPPFYQPYPVKKKKKIIYYTDGEIKATLSTHVAKDAGADLIIASYTHQPYHYTKSIGSLIDYGMPSIMIQSVYQAIEQKIQTSRRIYKDKGFVLDTVSQFFKKNHLPEDKRKLLCDQLSQTLDYNENRDYIYIHPEPKDHQLFFGDHFNLSPKIMEQTVKSGFKAAIRVLKDYSF